MPKVAKGDVKTTEQLRSRRQLTPDEVGEIMHLLCWPGDQVLLEGKLHTRPSPLVSRWLASTLAQYVDIYPRDKKELQTELSNHRRIQEGA